VIVLRIATNPTRDEFRLRELARRHAPDSVTVGPEFNHSIPEAKNLTSTLGFSAFENSLALVSGVWDSS
jgi:hypothetical protein